MSKQLRYMGEFLSHKNVLWRVEILQEASKPFANIGSLTFEADEALTIEWEHRDKEEVICGSRAKLQIESPGDRTYEDLYSIEVGQIRMDVYRNNQLHWSGALDPEFYEEPYEKARNYVVSLTFSDFGILERLKYNLSGMQTMLSILTDALQRSTINYGEVDTATYISTYFDGSSTKVTPETLSIRSENFFDEDGEPNTLEEVLTGMFQPLAIKMIQRNGKIYLFDLNGLYEAGERRAITWDGDSQTMGVDKVANNVTIGFSPYADAELMDGKLEFGEEVDPEQINLVSTSGPNGYWSYYPDYADEHRQGSNWDYNLINFTIHTSPNGKGLNWVSPQARFFKIVPMVGGPSECTGIAWGFKTGGHGALTTGWPIQILNSTGSGVQTEVFRTNKVFLPKLSDSDRTKYRIRLSLDLLLDARYNPFTQNNNGGNEEDNYHEFEVCTGWAFVPIAVTIYDNAGNAICHYDNKDIAQSSSIGHLGYAKGKWVNGAAQYGDAWLEYYDPDDLKERAGILGWKANRHCIGRPDSNDRDNTTYGTYGGKHYIYDSFKQMDDGEYMPYPEYGGWLEIKVFAAVRCYDYGEKGNTWETIRWPKSSLYQKVRWHLYKAPIVTAVKNNLIFEKSELDDVEYSGYINKAAKEEISIDTICGTNAKTCPTAKGIYHRTSDSLQIQHLKRANKTDHPERLLIGTLYSQYAERHTTLSGEAVIDSGGLCVYTERNQSGKVFLMSEETQNVICDTTEATYTELSPDEYTAIEEVTT